jgi:hypothetical protein
MRSVTRGVRFGGVQLNPRKCSVNDLEFCKFLLKGETFIPGIMEGELFGSGELDPSSMLKFTFF